MFKIVWDGEEFNCTTLYSVYDCLDHYPFLPFHAMNSIMDWCSDEKNYIHRNWKVWAGLAYYWVDVEVQIYE